MLAQTHASVDARPAALPTWPIARGAKRRGNVAANGSRPTVAYCPSRIYGTGITILKIQAGSPPKITTSWCGAVRGRGSPIVTTTDGCANPIVWTLGAEGDNRLHGFRGDTGELLVTSPGSSLTGLRHFQSLIATPERLYVGADGGMYAFAF
jgi:hypothetical protein